jgi:hypothetical protein
MSPLRVMIGVVLTLLVAEWAPAQTTSGGFASATVSAAVIEDGTSASIAAGVGYRLNAVVMIGMELTFIPSVTPELSNFPRPLGGFAFDGISFPVPDITFAPDRGHATIFTTNLRLTIPTRMRHLSPYLVGGAGVGTVTENILYIVYPPSLPPTLFGGPAVVTALAVARPIARTTTDFAATLGGGISVLIGDHWSVDVDARYIGFFGDRETHIGRYGAGPTYRF